MSNAGFLSVNAAGIIINPSSGGTGVANPPANTVAVAEGAAPFHFVGPGTLGQVLQSGGAGADPAYSTATFPSTATVTGSILRADGTNWSATTATYPNTTTANQLLFSSAANTITGLTSGNSQVAATNSSGVMAMRSFSVNTQVFTSSGTYTPSTGMLYCTIEVVGGGGGSGGCATTGANQYIASAGGGGGGYARGNFSAATIGVSQGVVVGAGGLAGAIGNNPGGTGGTTTVGALISATGGAGGGGGVAGASGGATGGAGGIAAGGYLNTVGTPGGSAEYVGNSFLLTGFGGSSYFGGGAPSSASATAAIAGQSFGGGAAGGANLANTGQIAGAAGAKGVVIITEYIIN